MDFRTNSYWRILQKTVESYDNLDWKSLATALHEDLDTHFRAQLAKYLSKRKMFQTENADKLKHTFYEQYTYPVNLMVFQIIN
jgi:hypothetical protein